MDARDGADTGLLIQELVYAGMEALRAAVPMDLCAYLHCPTGQGPQLYLGTPDLSSIGATDAFNLFTALRDALDHEHDADETLLLGGYLAVTLTTAGASSRGLHVVGRRESPLEPGERALIVRLARAVGGIIHRLEGSEDGSPGASPIRPAVPLRVAVETIEGRARAEVTAPFGDEVRTGIAEESTPTRAVVTAVIDAADASLKLVDTGEGEIGGERATLVLIGDSLGRRALGSALSDERSDRLQAAAIAALEAAARLLGER